MPPPLQWPLQTKVPEHSLSTQHGRNLLMGKIRAFKKPFFLTPCFCVPELYSGQAEKHPHPRKLTWPSALGHEKCRPPQLSLPPSDSAWAKASGTMSLYLRRGGELKAVTYHHRGDTHHSATATGCSSAWLPLCNAGAFLLWVASQELH